MYWQVGGEYKLSGSQSFFLALMLFLVLSILLALISWLLTQYLINPIIQLRTGTRLFASGNFNYRIPIKTKDEVGEAANDLNLMANNISLILNKFIQEKNVSIQERNKAAIALSTIADAVIAVDLNRNITIFNNAASDLTGYGEAQVLGKPISQVIKVFENKDELSPVIYCPLGTGSEDATFKKDGLKIMGKKESDVNMIAKPIVFNTGVNLGCILTIHDITNEKALEAMKLDFVSMAAHELRTPLTSIKGCLSVFMEENMPKFDADQKMFLERIDMSTQQLMTLVENLLNVSRVERGTFTVHRQPIEWVGLVKQIAMDSQSRAKEKKIQLVFMEPEFKTVTLEVDKLRITEVVTNLINNAINYTPNDGTITVWIDQDGNSVSTHVKDTGIGIPRDAQARLFSKFYRVANDQKVAVAPPTAEVTANYQGKLSATKGTDLGLYISKAILELHHGKIWVESEVGNGSVFSFSLPLPEEQAKL